MQGEDVDGVDVDKLIEVFNGDFGRFAKAEALATAALRKAIITGVLPPGQPIDEEMVAELLEMSRMPVRQAMGVLEAEGLVRRVYKRGVTVTELTASEIEELYHIRANLEGLAIRRACPLITDEHLERVKSILEQLQLTGDDIESFSELNTQFHSMLYDPSEWDTLNNMIMRLRNNVARYISISHHFIQQLPHVGADHPKIFEACVARDADLAEQLTRSHILNAMKVLLKSFTDNVWTNAVHAGPAGSNLE